MSPTEPRRRLDLSLTQVVAGALAAVSAAWAASVLGVAGTVIGAAVVSVTITVLSAVYQHGARRTAEGLRARRRAEMAAAPWDADDDDEFDLQRTMVLPALDLEDERGYRWGRIALLSLGVFLLAMAAVTVLELSTGGTLACSAFGQDCEQRTTVTPGLPARTQPRPTPTATAQPSTSASASASPTGAASPSASASPTGSASPAPSATDTFAAPSPTTSPTPATTSSPSPGASTG
ncbi:MAG TPA: hypothetical protein VIM19_13230 [Actinomycetes bacterium]